ncbi:MAG: TMEM165/GDT1 family protein [Thermoplasmata archaeon]|nr:TMEM165/GDT1 family protein [Thermoplasmata archaeon]MCI4341463.1 TMEM165/GDT1 family protein [Thermoplasmata archaeon]
MIDSLLEQGALVFGILFAFELVDRTNFGVIALSARHPPNEVWLGASLAFVASTILSVAIGVVAISFLAHYLVWVKVAGGLILGVFGVRGLLHGSGVDEEKTEREHDVPLTRSQVRALAFGLILFLEMGDNTQILTILFVASTGDPLLVFVAAVLALVSVAAIGSRSGEFLRTRVPAERLERILAGLLLLIGILTVLLALDPRLLPFL